MSCLSDDMCNPDPVPNIPESAMSYRFVRSSGPGGQHVNKVSTAVQLRVQLARTRLEKPVLERLIRMAGHQVNGRGELVINAERFRSQVRNREDALEIAQDSFAKAYRAMGRFDTKMPFYPWLYRIIKNTCLNHIKKRNRRGERSLDGLMDSGIDFSAKGRGPDGHAGLSELGL